MAGASRRTKEVVCGSAHCSAIMRHPGRRISSVTWQTGKPLTTGTRLDFVARFLGRTLSTYEVIDFVPDERLVMATAEGPFPMETTDSWTDVPGGCTPMTLRNRGMPSGFAGLTAPAMAAAMQRANRKDLAALKVLLERQFALDQCRSAHHR
jgi:hypothetical protein